MNVLRWSPFVHLFDTPFQNSPYGHVNLKHMVNDFVLRSTLLNLKHIVNDFVFRSTQPDVFFNTSILKDFHKIPHKVSTFDFGIATD